VHLCIAAFIRPCQVVRGHSGFRSSKGLLPRFHLPSSGTVLVNGRDVGDKIHLACSTTSAA
jgi:hypothetical protein